MVHYILDINVNGITIHFRQDHQTRGSLYQCTGRRAVVGNLDEAAHQADFDLRWPQMDAHKVWHLSPILATAARAAFTVTLAQTNNQLLIERAAWHEVERIVMASCETRRSVLSGNVRFSVRAICYGDQYLRSR